MWYIRPLEGKYYGTKVQNTEGDFLEVWLHFKNYSQEEVSEREKELGWGKEGDFYYDHVESQRSYDIAKTIVEVLNERNL